MIDYVTVYHRVEEFLKTRRGLSSPKKKTDFHRFVYELTGLFCGKAYQLKLTTQDIVTFFDIVQNHTITNISTDGKVHNLEDLLDEQVRAHPLFYATEHDLVAFKPGSAQIGLGEFFVCFYDAHSLFGIDNTNGFDVVVDSVPTELKTLGSRKETEDKFDDYSASPKVDRLMVILKMNGAAKKPRFRTRYVCIDMSVTPWRSVFGFNGDKLILVKE